MGKLVNMIYSFNPKKASGGDGLTRDICAEAIMVQPDISIANKSLTLLSKEEILRTVERQARKSNYIWSKHTHESREMRRQTQLQKRQPLTSQQKMQAIL
ncbi:unnamed protein product [Pieris brassicae]|uniref:Uncharacterized protein n=1 Tax=Pieris brassicae TaxID=7116 RepID=A0A9P0TUG4_PIEBR|nr:unnamed protein product [Pieris brassicae]